MTHEGSIPPPHHYPDPVLSNVNMWPVNHKTDGPHERVQSYLDTQVTCCLCCKNLECCGGEGCCHVGVESATKVKAKASAARKTPKTSDEQLEDAVSAMEAEGAPSATAGEPADPDLPPDLVTDPENTNAAAAEVYEAALASGMSEDEARELAWPQVGEAATVVEDSAVEELASAPVEDVAVDLGTDVDKPGE